MLPFSNRSWLALGVTFDVSYLGVIVFLDVFVVFTMPFKSELQFQRDLGVKLGLLLTLGFLEFDLRELSATLSGVQFAILGVGALFATLFWNVLLIVAMFFTVTAA